MLAVSSAHSLPQFANLKGLKCINCHINAQGGGLRNFRGLSSFRHTSLLKPEKIGLEGLYERDLKTNNIFNERLNIGTDIRIQSFRSHDSEDAIRKFIPMQAAIYSSFRLTDLFQVEGSYNFGPKRFFGQQKWTASVHIQPRYSFTQLRIGYFQPSIGTLYDDHTSLARMVGGAYETSLIPPNYAETGAELTYNGKRWLSLTTGLYRAHSLAENFVTNKDRKQISLIKNKDNPSVLNRIEFRRNNIRQYINANAGMSYLVNGDFSLLNLFSGVGIDDKISILAGYAYSNKKDLRKTKNATLDITYKLLDSLLLYIRSERGITNSYLRESKIKTYTNQGVAGIQIFILPYIELRPEYRFADTEQYRSTRYALQLHVFH